MATAWLEGRASPGLYSKPPSEYNPPPQLQPAKLRSGRLCATDGRVLPSGSYYRS
jgi:hypothetical protein